MHVRRSWPLVSSRCSRVESARATPRRRHHHRRGCESAPPTDPMAQVSPLDPAIKRGTWRTASPITSCRTRSPRARALWLAVNAGSVLEDDDQRGLAHFVEHMAFNGTKRFPKQEIVDFIEKAGMRFGADVNAYTSFDETVYQLRSRPTTRRVLKGLDILRDWAGDMSFDPARSRRSAASSSRSGGSGAARSRGSTTSRRR